MVLAQNVAGVSADDRRRLDVVGEMRLGEMVNKIQKVDVEESGNAVVVPKAFMGTVSLSHLFLFLGLRKEEPTQECLFADSMM